MSAKDKKLDIINRLRKSQENEQNEIMLAAENIKNITTGMDVVQVELDKLVEAPKDWNFYSPLSKQKMGELIESILENGLLSPIILWEQEDNYMILAGHNRVKAFRLLYENTKDDKYRKIYAYIKKKNQLSEDEAKSIIIDTNFVQRQLSTAEKTRSIVVKYNQLGRKKRNSEGKNTAAIIADQYGISERMVYNYYKINNLIPEFMESIDNCTISLKAGLKLAAFDSEFQEELYLRHSDKLDNKTISKINIHGEKEEILKMLSNDALTRFVKVSLEIPSYLEKEFKEYVNTWLNERVSRDSK
ncbi:ParB N-terminal domain-containing protein [Clostridium sp. YIM B02515]|uniref:ParB N-terminal domain-containing protein n=1 Tax=Clostridium rhizosphaerae TaxID=2803861 RepID=A0ABS1TEE0_9CLOT|nr:ParB/RepB/Spo0J family partition protein [Clostridium rhizosphaerae]MBL4937739.1 ParB N-terminal domain-containing protein [Clostridium rhizosphaerae]